MDSSARNEPSPVEDQPRLVMESGLKPGQTIVLAQNRLTLGRSSENDIVLLDLEVSRFHACLRQSQLGWLVEDLGSTNGTYVNGNRLTTPHLLAHGDVINLSDEITFTFRHRPPAPGEAVRTQRITNPSVSVAQGLRRLEEGGETRSAGTPELVPTPPAQRPRRLGQNSWFLAFVAAVLIVGGFLCVALLAYLSLPASGVFLDPTATVVPQGAVATPPAIISTSVPLAP